MSIETSFDLDFTLNSLEIENFMAYPTLKLDFQDKDIIGVLAQYAKDKTRSNRSGKTVILEAIRYLITGKHRATTDRQLIHNGKEHMIVKGVFTDGQKDYVIRRGCDAKGKGLLEVDWVTNSKSAQNEINSLFGVTPDDIDLTNFFKQADIMGFMGMTPAKKTEFLMKYIENQHWSQKEALANADRTVVKQKIRDNDTLKATLESGLEVDIGLEGMRDDQQTLLTEKNDALSELKNKSAEITGKLRNIAENKRQITNNINTVNDQIDSAEEELLEANEHEKNYQQAKLSYAALQLV
jgi:DNA repair exonuclease SbcCD ATPase subunit